VAAPGLSLADGLDGPPLIAWYPAYNQGIANVARHGPLCLNRDGRMPADRQSLCGMPVLAELGTGRYVVSVTNGAPFPTIDEDSGFLAFVSAIGSNARCFEEDTAASGMTLESVVHCVDPATGDDVDSEFSWAYRADSLDYPQEPAYTPTAAYARVEPDGTLVPEESFNPLDLHDDDVRVEKGDGAGRYTVTFLDMNPLEASLEPTLTPYNVIVQRTCVGDTAGGAEPDGCFRAVCAPSAWTPGDFETRDTSIDVRCFSPDGTPRDTGFRVFFGDEGFNSQGNSDGGNRYGWVDWSIAPDAEGCHTAPEVMSNSQHETPPSYFPGFDVQTCRTAVGTYDVNFEEEISFYSADGPNPFVSTRETDGRYCNIGSVFCTETNGSCGIPGTSPNPRITVTCFDSAGNPADSRFTMNMTY
jgi:hypothetical protein